ncbi:MAG: flagellar motor protein MotB [Cupriavidus sp.]|nr:flagellar motor protein MotB [Cupriavidus sp.]
MTLATGYPHRTLVVWGTGLALAWLAFSSPLPSASNAVIGAIVVALTVATVILLSRQQRTQRHAALPVLESLSASLDALPGDIRRNTPLILVLTEPGAADSMFHESPTTVTDAAIWIRVDNASELAHIAHALSQWRAGQGPDGIACMVGADHWTDSAMLNAALRRWQSAIGGASRALGYALPVCLAVYGEETGDTDDACPWFGMSGSDAIQGKSHAALIAARAMQYARGATPECRAARMRRAAHVDALARWSVDAVLPAFVNARTREAERCHRLKVVAFGVTLISGTPNVGSLLARFRQQVTALRQIETDGPRSSPYLPAPLIQGIGAQPVRRILPQALAHALIVLLIAFCAACAASAWQNRALATRVIGHIDRYSALTPDQDAARLDALDAIKADRDELDRYARTGTPLRLGLGFYRGDPLLNRLNALIASYQPPAPPPTTIELDSLSLFNSGSATLNPGSNRVLIDALRMIAAHPDMRVVVAGHTDSLGNARSNIRLSLARASAVRDWLADAAELSPTRFAIQGYGDTRPRASNTTETGRAANRRVEITLVPDCRDDRRDGRITAGHQACSFQ